MAINALISCFAICMENYRDKLDRNETRFGIYKTFYKKLKQKRPVDLDGMAARFHEEVFEETDCLACANCCKTISPIFRDTDIDRIARHLKMKPSVFVQKYLHLDEENDYVLNSSPCSFIDNDNYCLIYDVRPAACREYPHTDRKRFYQVIDKTVRSLKVCPAVIDVTEKLKNHYRDLY